MFSEIILHDFSRPLHKRLADRKFVGPYRWRPAKPGAGLGFYCAGRGLACDPQGARFALRLSEANDALPGYSRLRHVNGYFCDACDEGDTLQPIVARLPRSRGFLAGWTMGAGMCAALDPEIYTSPRDAAFAAHDMAEREAENMREQSAKDLEDA